MSESTPPHLSMHSRERAQLKELLDSLTVAADWIEDADASLAEVLLCMSDLLDGFLRSQRGVYLSNEEWRELAVSPAATLAVLDHLVHGRTEGKDKTRSVQIRVDACGMPLALCLERQSFKVV